VQKLLITKQYSKAIQKCRSRKDTWEALKCFLVDDQNIVVTDSRV